MNKKWLLLLASMVVSASMVAGCGANDEPSPPVDENQEEAPFENDPLHDAEDSRDDIDENIDPDENMEGTEENLEAPFEDPDNDGNDEIDPNPAEE